MAKSVSWPNLNLQKNNVDKCWVVFIDFGMIGYDILNKEKNEHAFVQKYREHEHSVKSVFPSEYECTAGFGCIEQIIKCINFIFSFQWTIFRKASSLHQTERTFCGIHKNGFIGPAQGKCAKFKFIDWKKPTPTIFLCIPNRKNTIKHFWATCIHVRSLHSKNYDVV